MNATLTVVVAVLLLLAPSPGTAEHRGEAYASSQFLFTSTLADADFKIINLQTSLDTNLGSWLIDRTVEIKANCGGTGTSVVPCSIDGADSNGLLDIRPPPGTNITVTLSDFRLINGNSARGGAVRVFAGATFVCNSCYFVENFAREGGGAVLIEPGANARVFGSSMQRNNGPDGLGKDIYVSAGSVLELEATVSTTSSQIDLYVAEGGNVYYRDPPPAPPLPSPPAPPPSPFPPPAFPAPPSPSPPPPPLDYTEPGLVLVRGTLRLGTEAITFNSPRNRDCFSEAAASAMRWPDPKGIIVTLWEPLSSGGSRVVFEIQSGLSGRDAADSVVALIRSAGASAPGFANAFTQSFAQQSCWRSSGVELEGAESIVVAQPKKSSSLPIILGAVGGGVLLLACCAYLYRTGKQEEEEEQRAQGLPVGKAEAASAARREAEGKVQVLQAEVRGIERQLERHRHDRDVEERAAQVRQGRASTDVRMDLLNVANGGGVPGSGWRQVRRSVGVVAAVKQVGGGAVKANKFTRRISIGAERVMKRTGSIADVARAGTGVARRMSNGAGALVRRMSFTGRPGRPPAAAGAASNQIAPSKGAAAAAGRGSNAPHAAGSAPVAPLGPMFATGGVKVVKSREQELQEQRGQMYQDYLRSQGK